MTLQRRRQPAGTGTAWKKNGEWSEPFDGSPLLGLFGDRCVDALEFAGQCSQAESGFIDLSSVCTDSLSNLWIDELANGLGEFIGCMFRDQQAVDAVFDLEWNTSMAGRDHRSPRRHGLNDHGGRPFFISVPRSHTGDQSEVGHFKPLADVIVINRAQEFHGVGRVKFVNQGFKFPLKGPSPAISYRMLTPDFLSAATALIPSANPFFSTKRPTDRTRRESFGGSGQSRWGNHLG